MEALKQEIKKNYVFYLVLLGVYYLVPFIARTNELAMFAIFLLNPIVCAVLSVFYTERNGFKFRFALATAVLFLPAIFIFYNSTALVYLFVYALFAIVAGFVSKPTKKKEKK